MLPGVLTCHERASAGLSTGMAVIYQQSILMRCGAVEVSEGRETFKSFPAV